jgi:hypothetical protein
VTTIIHEKCVVGILCHILGVSNLTLDGLRILVERYDDVSLVDTNVTRVHKQVLHQLDVGLHVGDVGVLVRIVSACTNQKHDVLVFLDKISSSHNSQKFKVVVKKLKLSVC